MVRRSPLALNSTRPSRHAKIVAHVLGDKVHIGKHRPKKGYRRRAGHRSHLTQVEIQKIAKKPAARKPAAAQAEAAEDKPKPARKPAARKTATKAGTE